MNRRSICLILVAPWIDAATAQQEVRVLPTETVSARELNQLRVSLIFAPVVSEDSDLHADLRIENVGQVSCDIPTLLWPSEAVQIEWTDTMGKSERGLHRRSGCKAVGRVHSTRARVVSWMPHHAGAKRAALQQAGLQRLLAARGVWVHGHLQDSRDKAKLRTRSRGYGL